MDFPRFILQNTLLLTAPPAGAFFWASSSITKSPQLPSVVVGSEQHLIEGVTQPDRVTCGVAVIYKGVGIQIFSGGLPVRLVVAN